MNKRCHQNIFRKNEQLIFCAETFLQIWLIISWDNWLCNFLYLCNVLSLLLLDIVIYSKSWANLPKDILQQRILCSYFGRADTFLWELFLKYFTTWTGEVLAIKVSLTRKPSKIKKKWRDAKIFEMKVDKKREIFLKSQCVNMF